MAKDTIRRWHEFCASRAAFLAALEQFDKEYPPATNWQEIDRLVMRDYIRQKNFYEARWFAVMSGIPIERIQAIEALLL